MNKLRIGLVGCGPIAQNADLHAIEKARDIHLQAIADTDAGLREAVALRYHAHSAYNHSDEIFADANVDLVILAVGDRLHVPLAKDAVRAGKHVLVEKPLGISTQECEELRPLHGTPMVNANLEDGIRAVKVMVAIGHSARHGGNWVNVEEVTGDLEYSVLKQSEPAAWRRTVSDNRPSSREPGLAYG